MSTAYCVSCSKIVPVTNVQRVTYPNGRTAERGSCACGRTTSKFLPSEKK